MRANDDEKLLGYLGKEQEILRGLKFDFNHEFNDFIVTTNNKRVMIKPEDGALFELCRALDKDYQNLARIQDLSMIEQFAQSNETRVLKGKMLKTIDDRQKEITARIQVAN